MVLAGPARRGGHRTSARTPRNTQTLGCGPAGGRRHPRAHTGIIVRARACTQRLRHIHACMCSWRLAHELTRPNVYTRSQKHTHTHIYVWPQAINGQVHTDTAPGSPSQSRVTYMHTNNASRASKALKSKTALTVSSHLPKRVPPTSCTPWDSSPSSPLAPPRPQPQPLPPPEFPGQLSTECRAWDRLLLATMSS